jgi:hypothetical protein
MMFKSPLFWLMAVTAMMFFLSHDQYQRNHPSKLDHSKWVEPYGGGQQEPIWGPGNNGDEVLGWHMVDDPKAKHFMMIEDIPHKVWIAFNGYLSFGVPVDTSKMSYHEKEANKYKKKIFFKLIDCMDGGSTIVSSDDIKFQGTVDIPTEVWNSTYAGRKIPRIVIQSLMP